MNIDTSIFKAYDIRGIYPDQLNENLAYKIACSFAKLIKTETGKETPRIGVGRDMRVSSPVLSSSAIQGLLDSGCDVVEFGLISTPTFYFGVSVEQLDGGMQLSASHNPKEWNGVKLVRSGGRPVSGDSGISQMRDWITSDDLPEKVSREHYEKTKALTSAETVATEVSQLITSQAKEKKLKVVIDTANAMGILDLEAIFSRFPHIELVKMNSELDGTFPAHEADPMKTENVEALCERVLAEKANFGIATDGDADRIFFVDEHGRVVHPSSVRALLAEEELKLHPGATIVHSIHPGRAILDVVEKNGGVAVPSAVGHSLIKSKMLEVDAVFGGENSGHFFYKIKEGTFEVPMLVVVKLLNLLGETGKTLSEIFSHLANYVSSGEISTRVESREVALKKIAEIEAKYTEGDIAHIDGVSVTYPEVWFNVRASNTEPLLRLTVEAVTQEKMEHTRDELLELIHKS